MRILSAAILVSLLVILGIKMILYVPVPSIGYFGGIYVICFLTTNKFSCTFVVVFFINLWIFSRKVGLVNKKNKSFTAALVHSNLVCSEPFNIFSIKFIPVFRLKLAYVRLNPMVSKLIGFL